MEFYLSYSGKNIFGVEKWLYELLRACTFRHNITVYWYISWSNAFYLKACTFDLSKYIGQQATFSTCTTSIVFNSLSQRSQVQILRGHGINVHESYMSDMILIGCTVCRVAMQISSLVFQYQPVLAGFLQHWSLPMLQGSSVELVTNSQTVTLITFNFRLSLPVR